MADPWAQFQDAAVGQFAADMHNDAWAGFADAQLPTLQVSPEQMRTAMLPGYKAARARYAGYDKLRRTYAPVVPKAVQDASQNLNDFQTQMARNTGAFDEVAGGMTFLTQGAENAFRRATGKPIEIPAATAARAAMDEERDQQRVYAAQHPTANAFAGLLDIPLSGRPTGATPLTNPFLAGASVATQNAPFAIARQKGNLAERLPGAALETGLALGTGAGLTAAGNAFAARAAQARAAPASDARQLADAGVSLTPGQMFGPSARRLEDAATSLPLTGAAINAAKRRGLQSFDVTAINSALAPIGEQVSANAGRGAVQEASQRVSAAYQRALNGVQVVPDAQYASDLQRVINAAPPSVRADVQDLVQSSVEARMMQGIDGRGWKEIDEELGALARRAANSDGANPVQMRYLRRAIEDIQGAHFDLLNRINPQAAQGVDAADAAFANMIRIQSAGGRVGTSDREGIFTPADLNNAVATSGGRMGRRQFAQGQATMQDVSDPAMAVLPSTVPDSGTALRGLIGAGAYGGVGTVAGHDKMLMALGIDAAGWALYSRPVQGLINAAYRATTPGQASEALGRLGSLAARDPGLVPVYRRLVDQLAPGLPGASHPQSTPQSRPAATTP